MESKGSPVVYKEQDVIDKTVVIAQILEDYPGILKARAQYLCELHSKYWSK